MTESPASPGGPGASPGSADEREVAAVCAEQLVPLYRTMLALTGDPDLAEDLAQDAIARGIQRARQYRGPAPVGAWVHRIALNLWRDHLRRRRILRFVGLDAPDAATFAAPAGRDAGEIVDVLVALRRLPERQRAAVVLRYYHDYDYAAIGEALGITAGSAGAVLSRALARLREELAD